MNRIIYTLAIIIGIGIFIFYYMINFDEMSETELVNKVLYWYVPLIFGIFGMAALKLDKRLDKNSGAISYLFSGKDKALTAWSIVILIVTGFIGALLLFVPLALIKPGTKSYDVYIAITGTLIWLFALWLFFVGLWPSL